ncbi:MAG: response regulator [Candidatus Omnitrophica bacterium]|nr:response regulator [Candidatus Omnitrophota bacterium]MDD5670608.1 response regulator [Candidatus Omnitrophota bacterium]
MGKKILVADDEVNIVAVVEARLKANGYQVSTAENGEVAYRKIQQELPDLIILDVMMPPPNGYQLCRMLKDDPQYKGIPVILLTAKSTESDKFWGLESGADAYVTKPYNSEELLKKIAELLEK